MYVRTTRTSVYHIAGPFLVLKCAWNEPGSQSFFGARDHEARSLGSENEPKVQEVQRSMFEIPRFGKFKLTSIKFELPKPWNFEH